MPKYLVHTVSSFRMTYLVEADCEEYASDLVVCNTNTQELDQEWIGDHIVTVQPVTKKQLDLFVDKAMNGHIADELIIRVDDE